MPPKKSDLSVHSREARRKRRIRALRMEQNYPLHLRTLLGAKTLTQQKINKLLSADSQHQHHGHSGQSRDGEMPEILTQNNAILESQLHNQFPLLKTSIKLEPGVVEENQYYEQSHITETVTRFKTELTAEEQLLDSSPLETIIKLKEEPTTASYNYGQSVESVTEEPLFSVINVISLCDISKEHL